MEISPKISISCLFLFFLSLLAVVAELSAQRTVGTVINNGAEDGYALFAPMNTKKTYLIDREGRVINSWSSDYIPGLTVYLGMDGSLYRAGRVTDSTQLQSGGAGGIIERFNWQGDLLWQFRYANAKVRQHHDFEVMPNGNILLIAWEEKSKVEAIRAGRDPGSMGTDKLWPDHLVEVVPEGFSEGSIVWEWHVWDHLIQDYDPMGENYGIVSDHPELIDINYYENKSADWIHGNSIEYNRTLDQIAFSSRAFNEIWLIDHSTTTAQAASHQGGIYGKGGDLLFRWGNNEAFRKDTTQVQKLFGQHGLFWIDDQPSDPLYIFNNGNNRPSTNYASIEKIVFSRNSQGEYSMENGVFLPTEPSHTFVSKDTVETFAPLFSNVIVTESNQLLLCIGPRGTFIQYNDKGEIIWKYVSPVLENGNILRQGESIGDQFASNNSVFGISFYPPTFPGFSDRNLSPGATIERDSLSTNAHEILQPNFTIFPNPTHSHLHIVLGGNALKAITISDVNGKIMISESLANYYDLSGWQPGIYFVSVLGQAVQKFVLNP